MMNTIKWHLLKSSVTCYLTIAALCVFTSCTTKFNTGAPYKNIIVIYAYLDVNDTAHYVRIQKAFLDQTKSGLTMAQTPDSSFYTSLNVTIKILSMSDSVVMDSIHLYRVDLNNEGYPKQKGIFFNAPNYAYKFTSKLNPNYLYRIVVTNTAAGQVDSAETPVIDDNPSDIEPVSGKPYLFSAISAEMTYLNFALRGFNTYYECGAVYTAPQGFAYENLRSPAIAAQVVVRFNWEDSNQVTGATTKHSFDMNTDIQILNPSTSTNLIDFKIPNAVLFNAIIEGMGPAPLNTIRLIDTGAVFIYLSTKDYVSFETANLTQGVGLTGDDVGPVYTNIKGPGALGLFTSRAVQQGQMVIDEQTLDTLKYSKYSSINNIKGRVW